MGRTTVAVSMETRDALKRLGRKGETYDLIIRRLISRYRQDKKRRNPAPRRADDSPMDVA